MADRFISGKLQLDRDISLGDIALPGDLEFWLEEKQVPGPMKGSGRGDIEFHCQQPFKPHLHNEQMS